MARTRGSSNSRIVHMDDGELIEAVRPVEAEPEPRPEPKPESWLCDPSTVQRDMDGWEAVRVLDILLGGLSATFDAEQFRGLPADVRRHFRRVS